MYQFGFAIPSLFIIIIILMFYFSLPRLSVRKNYFFLMLLIIEASVISLDILSSYTDNTYQNFPTFLINILNAAYFVAFFSRGSSFFLFTASCCRVAKAKNIHRFMLLNIPLIISCILAITSPWTGLIFSITEEGYVSGPMYNILYVEFGYFLFLSFATLFLYGKNIKRKRHLYSVFFANTTLLTGIILRKMMPHLLLMDTFCLISILIVYLAMENPEFYLEARGSVFNATAFRDYIDENNGRLHHGILGVIVKNYHEMRDIYGGRQIDEGVILISNYLTQTFKDVNTFYYRKGRFILLGSPDMDYEKISRTIRERFDLPWIEDNLELYLDVGMTYFNPGSRVQSADALLNFLIISFDKVEKDPGRSVMVLSDEDMQDNEGANVIKRLLETAVDSDAVEVFLQPLIDAGNGVVRGAEALCRIRDEEGRLLPPASFIHIAEANGRINQLGEQVFEKTCKFIKEYDMDALGLEWINVNLSPVQFMKTDLAERYDAIVKKYGVDPKMIHLEITEESMIDENFLYRQISNMQRKGFEFVLDDYGTGYSNLTRLKKCSFINVKLDMSVVWDYYKDPDEILPSMIQAFKHMNFEITSEGIEDERMARMMSSIGCDFLQGYYYSRPLPMNEFCEKFSI